MMDGTEKTVAGGRWPVAGGERGVAGGRWPVAGGETGNGDVAAGLRFAAAVFAGFREELARCAVVKGQAMPTDVAERLVAAAFADGMAWGRRERRPMVAQCSYCHRGIGADGAPVDVSHGACSECLPGVLADAERQLAALRAGRAGA